MNESLTTETGQYLTFNLADELFAIDISQVKEVLDNSKITRIPRTPDFMRGVINLRGSIVPVVDMRLKMDMPGFDDTKEMCIIIIEKKIENEDVTMGALVDSVQEVFELGTSGIEAPPRIGTRIRNEFIRGMGKKDDKFVIILDIDRIFSAEELLI